MKKRIKVTTILIILLILVSFVIGVYAYFNIEGDKIASHWDVAGEVNDYMPKFWGIFLFPLILVGVYLLFLFIPKIDPLKKNIEKFRKYYDLFILIMILFFFYVFLLSILANFGYAFNMTILITPPIGVLFIFIGLIMKKLKRNWFIGIRTPWTLSSDKVWEKTHRLGGILFMVSGIIVLAALFFPSKYLLLFMLIPIFILIMVLILYSYFLYRKTEKPLKNKKK